jgi:hypothetical protein
MHVIGSHVRREEMPVPVLADFDKGGKHYTAAFGIQGINGLVNLLLCVQA